MNTQILTIVGGKASEDKWLLLDEAYNKVEKSSLPSAVLESHLTQDIKEPELWRIFTTWESIEAMNEYRKSVETPAWLLVFKVVGTEPELIVNKIVLSK